MNKSRDYFSLISGLSPASSTERSFIQVVEGPKGIQGDSGADGFAVYYGATAPTNGVSDGLMWVKTDSGKSYVYLSTESGSQFVDIFGSGVSVTSSSDFDFPTGAATGSSYVFENRTWRWSGYAWDYIPPTTNITIGLTAPSDIYGSFWYDISGSALLLGVQDASGNNVFVEV